MTPVIDLTGVTVESQRVRLTEPPYGLGAKEAAQKIKTEDDALRFALNLAIGTFYVAYVEEIDGVSRSLDIAFAGRLLPDTISTIMSHNVIFKGRPYGFEAFLPETVGRSDNSCPVIVARYSFLSGSM